MPDLSPQLLSAIALIWSIGNTVAIWLRKPGVDAQAAVEKLHEECVACRALNAKQFSEIQQSEERRLTEIETHLEHMPSSEELSRLDVAIREVAVRITGVHDRVDTMSRQLSRIDDYLLNHARHSPPAHTL